MSNATAKPKSATHRHCADCGCAGCATNTDTERAQAQHKARQARKAIIDALTKAGADAKFESARRGKRGLACELVPKVASICDQLLPIEEAIPKVLDKLNEFEATEHLIADAIDKADELRDALCDIIGVLDFGVEPNSSKTKAVHYAEAKKFALNYLDEEPPEQSVSRATSAKFIVSTADIDVDILISEMRFVRGVLDDDSDAAHLAAEYDGFVCAIHEHMRGKGFLQRSVKYDLVERRS